MIHLSSLRCLKVSSRGDFANLVVQEAIRLEKEAKNSSTYKSLFSTKGNLRRMRIIIAIAFFSQWSGVSTTSRSALIARTALFRII